MTLATTEDAFLSLYERIAKQCSRRMTENLGTSNVILSPAQWEILRILLTHNRHPRYVLSSDGFAKAGSVAIDMAMCGTTVSAIADPSLGDDDIRWSDSAVGAGE